MASESRSLSMIDPRIFLLGYEYSELYGFTNVAEKFKQFIEQQQPLGLNTEQLINNLHNSDLDYGKYKTFADKQFYDMYPDGKLEENNNPNHNHNHNNNNSNNNNIIDST